MNMLIIRGNPASGKSTIGKFLEQQGFGVFVDHNALLTLVCTMTMNDDGLFEDIKKLEFSIAKKLLKDGESIIIARGFNTKDSLIPYLELANDKSVTLVIIRLQSDIKTLAERMQDPMRKASRNPISDKNDLINWVKSHSFEDIENEIILNTEQSLEQTKIDLIKQIVARFK